MLKIILASNNAHKLREIREILRNYPIQIVSPKDEGIIIPEVEENGSTYEENALLKAKSIARLTKLPVFADDSGLEIKSMDNAPGIYSARYAESFGGHQNAFREIWNNIKDKDKSARFICHLALLNIKDKPLFFEGVVNGEISLTQSGNSGFGYDPIFIPEGYEKSFGELPQDVKNHISHRANALRNMVDYLLHEDLI
jgi:XTP/dITP diphosphohydrolase